MVTGYKKNIYRKRDHKKESTNFACEQNNFHIYFTSGRLFFCFFFLLYFALCGKTFSHFSHFHRVGSLNTSFWIFMPIANLPIDLP